MALLRIVKYGDPVLRKKTKPITTIDDALRQTIKDMFQTMYAAPGIGLAANQVGLDQCFAVIDIQPDRKKRPIVLINPKIEERSGELIEDEGCLSIPGFGAHTKRFSKVRVQALNEEGLPMIIEADGLMARCLQHEIDHLNGKFYIDHLPMMERMKMKRDIEKRIASKLF